MSRFSNWRLIGILFAFFASSLLAGFTLFPRVSAAIQPDPVTAAWQRAQAAGSYQFESDIVQVTVPVASIANVGRSNQTTQLHVNGKTNLHTEQLEMQFWVGGGSVLQPESAAAIKIENGKSYVRKGAGAWQEDTQLSAAGGPTFAPAGDVMAYLRAVRDIQAHAPEQRAGIAFTRYSFQIDSPRLAAFLQQQLEATLRARGELPPGVQLETPPYYRDMIGSGELWVNDEGLPLRQILTLQFPPQRGEQLHSRLTMTYSHFGAPAATPNATLGRALGRGDLAALWGAFPRSLPDLTLLWLLAGFGACAMLTLRYRRTRLVEAAIVVAVIFSQVVGPILTTYTNVKFVDAQTARAAAQEEEQNAIRQERDLKAAFDQAEFNPHQNPLEAGESRLALSDQSMGANFQLPVAALQAAPAAQLTDNGTDSDSDGLSDFVEERIGARPTQADSDLDGLNDAIEINGFSYDNKLWYLDANAGDSNGDGLSDALEWGFNANGSRRAVPLDTDNDKFPDLFDDDNDNDGVPDNKDLAPFVKGASTYSEASSLHLSLQNLAPGMPTYVEFQLRPQNPDQLWYAFNVLDWPQDSKGQVQDIDNTTFADYAAAQGRSSVDNEADGDMKIIPMLEIRMPATGANLPPTATQTFADNAGRLVTRTVYPDLAPFNITVNDFTPDGATKVAYVPLSVVADEKTGERLAFSGQMLYLPNGNWPAPHDVRLVWVVQALNDQLTNICDNSVTPPVVDNCTADGYIHNVGQMIQSYYSDWTLTGLTVREERGAKMSISYGDPTVGSATLRDDAVNALAYVLDNAFVVGRDSNNDNERDLTVDKIYERFDRTRNGNFSEQQRYAVPNVLRVEKQSYPTLDQAASYTAMTETVRILNNMNGLVAADPSIKPLLLFAHENQSRLLSLDTANVSNGYVTQNGANLVLNMQPPNQPPQETKIVAGMRMMAYCPTGTGTTTWNPCSLPTYWAELERRHPALLLSGESDPDLAQGRLFAAQLYYASLSSGIAMPVQEGAHIVSGFYSLLSDSTIEANVRYGIQIVGAGAPLLAAESFENVLTAAGDVTKTLGKIKFLAKLAEGETFKYALPLAAKIRALTSEIKQIKAQAAFGAIGAVAVVLTQFFTFIPGIPTAASGTLYAVSTVLSIGLTVVKPILALASDISSGATTLSKALTSIAAASTLARVTAVIGVVITIGVSWGILFYTWAVSGLDAGSPELNKAFAETVATTVVVIYLAVMALTPVGAIIAAIIAVIDFILTVVCELGVPELRTVPGMGGACWTISNQVIRGLSYFLYNYDVMINTDHKDAVGNSDLTITGFPQVTLADPTKGYVAGNALSLALPVTTTIRHKDPDPNNGLTINGYLWLFSPDNLRSSTFNYSLSRPNEATVSAALDQMPNAWNRVEEDHKYVLTPMYRGQAAKLPALPTGTTLSIGLDQTLDFYLNTGYAIPAYECWLMPHPLVIFAIPPIPVCYVRESTGNTSNQLTTLKFDVFPPTLDGFMALTSKANGGLGLAWDSRFGVVADADGDGLRTSALNGIDPNDSTWDTDGDGLSDMAELERRAAGAAMSPILRDSDNDGLTDLQEIRLGSDPGVADTDNDGLLDGEEVRHLIYDANGMPTSNWAGGWQVRINASSPFSIWVSSDPNNADSDGDSISDQAERQLALSTCSAAEVTAGNCEGNPPKPKDNQNRPYHPLVANTPPLAVFVDTNDSDGFLRPGQSFNYTSTVVANTALAPGVLNMTAPAVVGGPRNPAALAFNPLTFSGSQTVTHVSNFAVLGNAATQAVDLNSTASTRLTNLGAPAWAWDAATTEAPFGGFGGKSPRFVAGAAASRDRQDSYRLVGQTSTFDNGLGSPGDVWAFDIPTGGSRTLEFDNDATTDPARLDNAAFRGPSGPAITCNNAGVCMAVWSEWSACSDVTINWLRVDANGDDGGSSGIEPIIFFVANGADTDPTDGGYELLWIPGGAGGGDQMTEGSQRGPDANRFPLTRTFCEPARLELYETDGISFPEANTDWSLQSRIGSGYNLSTNAQTTDVGFISDGHDIKLNITIADKKQRRVMAALIAPNGQVQRTQFEVTAPTGFDDGNSNPVVASDGNNFLVGWSRLDAHQRQLTPTYSTLAMRTDLVTRLFNAAGDPLTAESVLANKWVEVYANNTQDLITLNLLYPLRDRINDLALIWLGDRYRLVRRLYVGAAASRNDLVVETPNGNESVGVLESFDFDANGASIEGIGFGLLEDASDNGGYGVAYDPVRNRTLFVFRNKGNIVSAPTIEAWMFDGSNQFIRSVTLSTTGVTPRVAYHPQTQGWLVGWRDGNGVLQYNIWNNDLTAPIVTNLQSGFPATAGRDALVCPAPSSVPTLDLRFEELPGTTNFVDSSGNGATATCSGAGCPLAGFAGAPNAPLSDYAVQFDGVDDALTVNRSWSSSFSVAYWIKSNNNANNNAIVFDQGANTANGWALWLNNGQPNLLIGANQNISAPNRVDDGQWHFVVGTRNQSTGAVALYIDGNPTPVASNTFSTAGLNAVANLRIGGDRNGARDFNGLVDHIQIYPVALSGQTVQALYNRTNQSYCMAASIATSGTAFAWSRLSIRQQDNRGGRVSASNGLTLRIDNDAPTANLTSVTNNAVVPTGLVIAGNAADATSGVDVVEVSVNNGPWLPANGANSWTFSLAGYSGSVSLRARATDRVGNVGAASAATNLTVDNVAPQVTINTPPGPIKPTKNANGQWQVTLTGTATDNIANHIKAGSVQVFLMQQSGVGIVQSPQTATLTGNNWSVTYLLDPTVSDPTGSYMATAQAEDKLGNAATSSAALVWLDAAAPVATLSTTDGVREVISQTVTISGLITDVNSIAGIDQLELALTPVEEVAALPANITSAEADALLNRTWLPVSLAQRGAGVASTTWSFGIPAGLEDLYQLDLRSRDMLGNLSVYPNQWRGVIDTLDPRVVMSATYTGASYVDNASQQSRYEVRFVCGAVDRHLNELAFTCPGQGLAEPVRSFEQNADFQALFPDWTIRSGLALSYTLWMSTTTPAASASACDLFGRCAQAQTPTAVNAAEASAVVQAAAPGAPTAVIVNPTAGSFVAATDQLNVTVAAEAGAGLKTVTISLDNTAVQTLNFAQSEAVTRLLRTVTLGNVNEGLHTLVATATDWNHSTQTTVYPVRFTLDQHAPTLTIATDPLTIADTWMPESGVLRFNGTASDSVALAAVQIREAAPIFVDATFADNTWQVALPVQDPEGRTLTITVRAIDRAGRITQITQQIATNLSAADAPDTNISSGPANPSNINTANFVFSGSTSAVAFDCQLDDGAYVPCASPWQLTDLSKGAHSFRVRAIDGRGFADLTPASFTWTVAASQPDATITGKPENPTSARNANFTFSGDATARSFECSLDGSAFTVCASPVSYSGLGYGDHTFLVRARDAANKAGAADRYRWRVLNAPPTVANQLLMVVEDSALAITLLGTDNDALSYQIVEQPQNGILVGLTPNLTYVPNTHYAGPDQFTYRAWDGETFSAPATVNLTVLLGKYVLFAGEGLAVEQKGTVMHGDLGVNARSNGPFLRNNVEANFDQNFIMQDSTSRLLADSILVDKKASIYNPSYNDLTGGGTVQGVRTTPLALPLRTALPALPPITPGTQNVDVAQNGTRTLAPGSYGALNVAQNSTIIFTGGIYHFASWNVAQKSKLHFQAPSDVRIAGRLAVAQNGFVGPAPGATGVDASQIVIHVGGQNGANGTLDANPKAGVFEQNAVISAYIVVPNGTLQFRQNAQLNGAFIAKWVLVEQKATILRPTNLLAASATPATEELNDNVLAPDLDDATETPIETPDETPIAQSLSSVIFLPLTLVADTTAASTSNEAMTNTTTITPSVEFEESSLPAAVNVAPPTVATEEATATQQHSLFLPLVSQ